MPSTGVLALGSLQGVVQIAEPDFLTAGATTTPNDPFLRPDASDTLTNGTCRN